MDGDELIEGNNEVTQVDTAVDAVENGDETEEDEGLQRE